MGGGLMQLVAYGAQDVYLTGNPQITFFKVVYRRHTNFACEAIEQTFNGTPALGGRATVPITRNGDLVTKMWLKTKLTGTATNDDVGYNIIKSVELQIGGTKIDKHYGRWMHIWSELTKSADQKNAHDQMVNVKTATPELYVPLQFFCCRNDGLALPLIALQYHDVRLEFEFEAAANVAGITAMSNTTLLVNYIYLDSEERKRFAQASHEYLIEQLQFTGVETVVASGSNKIRLNFNHPVKELVWAIEKQSANTQNFNFTNNNTQANGANPVSNALLQLNGHDRFAQETGKFFNYVQPNTHHSRTPAAGINVYSFALNPEEHQPSGTCNFSRIDNATLNVTTATAGTQLYVYGVNYNVLRIMSGMGGVAYSN
jgi:hypothetical protein